MDVGSIVWTVEADTSQLNRARDDMSRVGDNVRQTTTATDRMAASARSATKALAGLFAAAGVAKLASEFYKVNVEAQRLKASLVTVTGSIGSANAAWAQMEAFARTTPYSLTQAIEGFTKMKALGLEPTTASMTAFGNVAAAMGKDLTQMIEAVADASTSEFERLKEFGIKAKQEGDRVKLTFQGVTTEIGNNAKEITGYLEDIGNNQFAGAMERQMATLGGAASNLGDNIDGLFRAIGESGSNNALTGATIWLSEAASVLTTQIRAADMATLSAGESATAAGDDFGWLHDTLIAVANVAKITTMEFTDLGDAIGYGMARAKLLVERDIAIRTFQMEKAESLTRQIISMDKDRADNRVAAEERIVSSMAAHESASRKLREAMALETRVGAKAAIEIERLINNSGLFAKVTEDVAEKTELTTKEIDKLRVSGGQLKDASGEWLTDAQKDLDQFLSALEKIDNKLAGFDASGMTEEFQTMQKAISYGIRTQDQGVELMDLHIQELIDSWGLVAPEVDKAKIAADKLAASADPFGKIWDTTIERLQGSIADAFYEMLETGKFTFDNILNLFKRMVAEMAAQKIMMSFSSQGGISMGGAGGFDLSSLFSLSNFSGMLSAGISGLGATLTSVLPAAMTQGLMQSGYSVISDAAFEAAVLQGGLEQGWNLAAGAGALYTAGAGILGGYAGTELGEALFGKQAESGYGAAAGAAAGAYVGSIVPVIGTVIGALIGGAIGGLIDVVSGGDGKQRYAVGVSTNAAWGTSEHATMQATGASGLKLTSYQKRAGEEGNAVAEAMTQAFLTTDAALTGFFRELGVSVDLAGQTLEGKASQFGEAADGFFGAAGFNELNPEDLEGAVDSFVMAWVAKANELTKSAIDLKPLIDIQREGELLADVLIRVYTQFGTINNVLESLGLNTYDVSVAGMAAADGLVALFGSLENFTTAASRYYDLFYTEQEKVGAIAEQVNSVFETLNITAPTTIAGFRDLVDEYGNMGQAGQATLATLLGIAPAFHQVATAAEAATKAADELAAAQAEQARQALAARNATIGDIAGSILQQYQEREQTIAGLQGRLAKIDEDIAAVYTRMDDAVKPVADTITQVVRSVDTLGVSSSQLRSIADNLLSTVDSLKLGNVSPLTNWQKLQEAQGQYNVAQSMARDGDPSQLAAAAQAYLAQAAGYYASSPAYVAIFDEVTGYLSAMGAELDQQATAAEKAERMAAAQQAALQAIESTSSKTVDLTQFYGDIEKLNAERLIIEQQLANLMAVDSQSIMTGQLDRLVQMTDGISTMTALLANMPTSIADGLASVLGIAIADYRALTPSEEFFSGIPSFSGGGVATGPDSGYLAMLHGTEVVTPAGNMQSDNSAVVEELRAVKRELQEVKTELKTANAQRGAANKTLGRIERASIRTVTTVPQGVSA